MWKPVEVSGKSILYKCLWLLLFIILQVSQSFSSPRHPNCSSWGQLIDHPLLVSAFLFFCESFSPRTPPSPPPSPSHFACTASLGSSHYNSSSPPTTFIGAVRQQEDFYSFFEIVSFAAMDYSAIIWNSVWFLPSACLLECEHTSGVSCQNVQQRPYSPKMDLFDVKITCVLSSEVHWCLLSLRCF